MKYLNKVRKFGSKAVFAGSIAAVGAFPALADDSAITSAINGAVAGGKANYTLVVVGLIGLAAIGFGLGYITSAMRR